ncbi:MAG: pyridoxal-phosphate dependent enzyme [Chloroflexi bacterium]|nr:pyridoxal-phosphate dependent enzyme [Chloroflexota bacterium]
MAAVTLRCPACAIDIPWDAALLACPRCDGLLDAAKDLPKLTRDIQPLIDQGAPGVWRYRPALALPGDAPLLTMGEGRTPVVELATWGGGHGLSQCRAKLEFMAPTGSFKDRGAAPVIASLKAQGVAKIVEDSSGNAGAAMAAYAARAGLSADIYVPAAAPAGKLAQIAQYGATVHPVEGTREDVGDAAALAAQAPGAAYASHSRHPAFLEGTKTFVLELLEDGVRALPQHLVVPVGNGGLILGAHKALTELRQAGLHFRMPRLHIAQAAACQPLVQAYNTGAAEPVAVERRPTIAGGIDVAVPARGAAVLQAARDTGGSAVAVGEDEIAATRSALARDEGLFVEATSAAAFAAAAQLRAKDAIAAEDAVLIAATGSGLKDPPPQQA